MFQKQRAASGWTVSLIPGCIRRARLITRSRHLPTNYKEEESQNVWQSGNAAFMRNWPYCYALGENKDGPISGKFSVTVLPKGGSAGKHAATLGGWQLMVSKYSKNPEVAADLVRYLTSAEVQKKDAVLRMWTMPTSKNLSVGIASSVTSARRARPSMSGQYSSSVPARGASLKNRTGLSSAAARRASISASSVERVFPSGRTTHT